MGKNIQKYTFKVIYKGILHELKSSVLKEELTYEKLKVIKLINTELGKEYIRSVILKISLLSSETNFDIRTV